MSPKPPQPPPRDPDDSLLRWTIAQLLNLQHHPHPPPRTLSLLLKKQVQG